MPLVPDGSIGRPDALPRRLPGLLADGERVVLMGSTSSIGGPTLTSGVAGPGGWNRRLYRSSGELGTFGLEEDLAAEVMVRLNSVLVRRLSGL